MHSKICSNLPHAYQAGTKQGGGVPEKIGLAILGRERRPVQLHFD
jgi:hypothetical protein